MRQGWAGEHHLDGMKRNMSDGKHGTESSWLDDIYRYHLYL